jgi:cytochrome c-type biogenesis protein CcmH
MPRVLVAALAGALVLATACDRRVEPYVPGEEPEIPDLSRIFPPEPAVESPAEGAPAEPPPPPGAQRAALSGPPVRGSVVLSRELAAAAPARGVLFVVARSPGGGPPLAVKRIEAPRFPVDFELGPDDRMIQTLPFRGPLILTARLDGDGNASSRSPGDVQGSVPAPVNPGDTGVRIVLDEPL